MDEPSLSCGPVTLLPVQSSLDCQISANFHSGPQRRLNLLEQVSLRIHAIYCYACEYVLTVWISAGGCEKFQQQVSVILGKYRAFLSLAPQLGEDWIQVNIALTRRTAHTILGHTYISYDLGQSVLSLLSAGLSFRLANCSSFQYSLREYEVCLSLDTHISPSSLLIPLNLQSEPRGQLRTYMNPRFHLHQQLVGVTEDGVKRSSSVIVQSASYRIGRQLFERGVSPRTCRSIADQVNQFPRPFTIIDSEGAKHDLRLFRITAKL